MKVLVLGGRGMLGHRLCITLEKRFEVWTTLLGNKHQVVPFGFISPDRIIEKVDIRNFNILKHAMETIRPDVVINAIGLVKQRDEAKKAVPSIQINALFPHLLAELCGEMSVRVIQFSTDCVFSGSRGNYSEKDIPDPVDLYGKSKLLGDLHLPNTLTLRTSFIGWQLSNFSSLMGWFASQRGKTIKGFTHAIYTGFSTTAISNLIGDIILSYPELTGLYHVSSAPISKYDLLIGLQAALGWEDIKIEPDGKFFCDRSLNSEKFKSSVGWTSPAWDQMINDLAAEWPIYEQWQRK